MWVYKGFLSQLEIPQNILANSHTSSKMSRVCPNYVSSLIFLKTICNYMNYDLLVAPLLTEYFGTTLKKIMPQALWIPFENSANQPLTKIYVKSTLSARSGIFFSHHSSLAMVVSPISCFLIFVLGIAIIFLFGRRHHFLSKRFFFLWESFTPLISQKLK